jgi:hypothetical protein
MSNNANFQVTRADDGSVVSGLISVLAPRGAIVVHELDANGQTILKPANGQRGFHLEREVVNQIPLENVVFLVDFIHPSLINTTVTARKCQEVQAEGGDLILLESEPDGQPGQGAPVAGAISAATPLGTPLSTNGGKFSVQQEGEELMGYLRAVFPPKGDGAFRIMVEEVG